MKAIKKEIKRLEDRLRSLEETRRRYPKLRKTADSAIEETRAELDRLIQKARS